VSLESGRCVTAVGAAPDRRVVAGISSQRPARSSMKRRVGDWTLKTPYIECDVVAMRDLCVERSKG
jgi:hypothetical protein